MSARLLRSVLRALDRVAPAPAVAPHLATGRRGEEDAYFYLRRRGYVMVARNYRAPQYKGELDLVGWDGDVLCFIEVKTRTTRDIKSAEASVDEAKQRDLKRVARDFRRKLPLDPPCRFDVVTIYYDVEPPQITLYKDAFRA